MEPKSKGCNLNNVKLVWFESFFVRAWQFYHSVSFSPLLWLSVWVTELRGTRHSPWWRTSHHCPSRGAPAPAPCSDHTGGAQWTRTPVKQLYFEFFVGLLLHSLKLWVMGGYQDSWGLLRFWTWFDWVRRLWLEKLERMLEILVKKRSNQRT